MRIEAYWTFIASVGRPTGFPFWSAVFSKVFPFFVIFVVHSESHVIRTASPTVFHVPFKPSSVGYRWRYRPGTV